MLVTLPSGALFAIPRYSLSSLHFYLKSILLAIAWCIPSTSSYVSFVVCFVVWARSSHSSLLLPLSSD